MKKLLLPYGKDINGNLVKIEDAQKEEKYVCPECGAELSMIISKKKEGEKYYRRPHFAHKGTSDNHCSESFLHRFFKESVIAFLQDKINKHEDFPFEWECNQCGEKHKGNLLKKAVKVQGEYDLKTCQPDIALFDENNKLIIVIEIVVTHKPEPEVLAFYKEKKVACIQINVEDFIDCSKIGEKIAHPSIVSECVNPSCPKCHKPMKNVQLKILKIPCWNCGHEMKIALLESKNGQRILDPSDFTKEERELAQRHGVRIEYKYSKTCKSSYWANTCEFCGKIKGKYFLDEYYYEDALEIVNAGSRCFECMDREKMQVYLEEQKNKR